MVLTGYKANQTLRYAHDRTCDQVVVAKNRDRVKPPIEKDMEGLYL